MNGQPPKKEPLNRPVLFDGIRRLEARTDELVNRTCVLKGTMIGPLDPVKEGTAISTQGKEVLSDLLEFQLNRLEGVQNVIEDLISVAQRQLGDMKLE